MLRLPKNPNDGISFEKEKLKTIYLAGGCFWGTQAYVSRLLGVVESVCGYANGRTEFPTYEQVCHENTGHAETVKVAYSPELLPLALLLKEFFTTINPTMLNRQGGDVGNQYRTGIYYTNEEDLTTIRQVVQEVQLQYERPVVTEVEALRCFYDAEEYHQHYLEKNPNGYCHVDLSALPEGGILK